MNAVRAYLALVAAGWAISLTAVAQSYTPGEPLDLGFVAVETLLTEHCLDCHSATDPAGGLSIAGLGTIDELNAATWRNIWAQIAIREMPPRDAVQPPVIDRLRITDWIVSELQRSLRDKGGFRDHLDPNKGNFVDHALLFSHRDQLAEEGIQLRPTASPARLWRVTPQEHITRLNELINTEPAYDAEQPGLRTHGDAVPTNHGGELKLYFGTDRIIHWQGGTVAYATAVKSLPAILSSGRGHGLENYADFYTVNNAEATQVMAAAEDLIRYMAYGPLSIANPEQITDDPSTYKMEGDIRGLPTSLVYSTKVVRPLTPVYELMKHPGVEDQQLRAAVDYLFEALTFRPPTPEESEQYLTIVRQAIEQLGKEDGAVLGLSAIFVDRDALFRPELVEQGTPDEYGRVMLQDWELGLAVNHALRYIKPDEELRRAITEGRMQSREDVRREVERMLADDRIRKPRVLQFFREFFDYDLAGYICKDEKSLAATGVVNRGTSHYTAMFDATASTDRLVELILQEDRQVLRRLLTTDQVVVTPQDKVYFGRLATPQERSASIAATKKQTEAARKAAKEELETAQEQLAAAEAELAAANKGDDAEKARTTSIQKRIAQLRRAVDMGEQKLVEISRANRATNHDVVAAQLTGPEIFARVSRRSFGNGSLKPERLLATIPVGQRLGVLTHPSWLVSHSDAMDNHAIRRGRWIRERLLGGGIPDVPITVDAMLPDEPQHTLRERMRVTREEYCWTCHRKMDPLGLPFEIYNHAGIYRTTELDQPIDASGEIIDSGDSALDGEVSDAMELISRLAESQRVEQVFVRHAFRFWMGRNETLNDAPVLQAAHRAYHENDGSLRALLVSLLTSDAFLYRVRSVEN